jgi:hypothetical protein
MYIMMYIMAIGGRWTVAAGDDGRRDEHLAVKRRQDVRVFDQD